jgi:hypothetical protein
VVRGLLPPDFSCQEYADLFVSKDDGTVPPFLTSMWELRLGDRRSPVDISVKIAPGVQLVRREAHCPLAFWSVWGQASSSLSQSVYHLGLEYDFDRFPGRPSFFFGLSDSDTAASFAATRLAAELLGREIERSVQDCLFSCLRAMPVGCRWNYAAIMLSRDSCGLRIGIEGMSPRFRIIEYLRRMIDVPLDPSLCAFLAELPATLSRASPILSIDLGARIGKRIGLEYLVCHRAALADRRAERLLAHLTDLGLCTQNKRDSLLRWRSEGFSWRDRFLLQPERNFSHIKIVFEAERAAEAKAYIEFTYR